MAWKYRNSLATTSGKDVKLVCMWIIFCNFHLLNPIAEGTATTSTLFKIDSLIYGYYVFQSGGNKSL